MPIHEFDNNFQWIGGMALSGIEEIEQRFSRVRDLG